MIESEIWAAIDLSQGKVVSLRKGNIADSMAWSDNPLTIAERWEREGANGLHVVDLDAALAKGSNRKLAESIARQSKIPVQVGGGIRTISQAQEMLEIGMTRVILGTIVFNEPSVLPNALRILGSESIVVAIDYRNDVVLTNGWTKESSLNVLAGVKSLEATGVKTILATSVESDGVALGPDIQMLRKMRSSTNMKILASGGIRNPADIQEIRNIGIEGAIVGRALYEGTIRFSEISPGA